MGTCPGKYFQIKKKLKIKIYYATMNEFPQNVQKVIYSWTSNSFKFSNEINIEMIEKTNFLLINKSRS